MKRNPSFIFNVFLSLGDILALISAFTLAYILRVTLTPRPFIPIGSTEFITSIIILIPVWIAVFYFFGLYDKSIYSYKPKEIGRLFLSSIVSMSIMISFSFFTDRDLFPAKLVAIYSLIFSYILLILNRWIIKYIRKVLLKRQVGILKAVIIGSSDSTAILAKYIFQDRSSEYSISGIVSKNAFIPEDFLQYKFSSLTSAIESTSPDIIIQTDNEDLQKNYQASIDHHLQYMFVPSQDILLSSDSSIELFGTLPVMQIKTTPLIGYGKFAKRICDIIFGALFLIVASPLILILAIISKLSDPQGDVFFKQKRLSIYNKRIYIHKFRSISSEYNKLSPLEAFAKMGRPELYDEYRANGDQLSDDPRTTKFGRFLRATSLDELPQLFDVVRGDISLVGPRSLVPGELNKYPNKNLILSVKSGLTGLAQISGRRDISFEERRKLDVYYVQNWSLLLDFQIIIKTIWSVLLRKGAR